MQQELNHSQSDSPFFSLMAEAEQIQVHEVESKQTHILAPFLKTPPQESERTFLVKIRVSRAPISTLPAKQEVAKKQEAPTERDKLLENAEILLRNGDLILARNIYSFLLKSNLKDQQAMEGLGICFLKLNEVLAAKKCFKALWELYQKDDYAIRLGLCFLADQDDDTALSCFEKVRNPDGVPSPLRFDFYKSRGNILNRKDRHAEAETSYFKALQIKPESDVVFVNLGTLELQRKNPIKAQKYFTRAIEIHPKSSKGHCGLGMVDLEQGDYFSAGREFKCALDNDSQNLVALLQLIYLSDFSKNYDEAIHRSHQFLDRDPNNAEVRFQLAGLLFRKGQFLEAESEINKAVKFAPQEPRFKKLKEHLTNNRHRG
ncbi:MAG: hypothetical protein EB120_13925 [Proteobacteria bacterium]|nr:hypothetical protein [Pseudomonadota bacterium]